MIGRRPTADIILAADHISGEHARVCRGAEWVARVSQLSGRSWSYFRGGTPTRVGPPVYISLLIELCVILVTHLILVGAPRFPNLYTIPTPNTYKSQHLRQFFRYGEQPSRCRPCSLQGLLFGRSSPSACIAGEEALLRNSDYCSRE